MWPIKYLLIAFMQISVNLIVTYAWNDIIGPNYAYTSDSQKAKLAKLIPFADPTDYEIHITWSDKTIISALGNTGWLSDIDKYDDCIGE